MHTHTTHVYILIDPEQKKISTMKCYSDLILLVEVHVNKM